MDLDRFDGDFDLLPFAAHIAHGAVPEFPTESDFHLAVSVNFGARTAASRWRVEAVRWRRANPGRPLNDGLKAIALATAAALYRERDD